MIEKIKNKIMTNNIVKNSLIIMSGQTVASIITFINTFIIINAIGIYGNGIIAIVQTYTNIFNGIFNFQSYNAIIKFGSHAIENKDVCLLKKYIKQAFVQDLITAIIAIIFGYIFIDSISEFMGWGSEIIYFIKIYLITIIFTITGSVNGVLRLFNEFKAGAIVSIKSMLIKLILLIIGIIMKLDINYYIIVEILSCIISSFMLLYEGYKCLNKNGCSDFMKVKIEFDSEFTMFNLHNNIVSTIDMPVGQLTNLMINKFLGISDVGIYNILVKLGGVVSRITEPVTQALLPELSKLVAKGQVKNAFKVIKKMFIYTIRYGIIILVGIVFTYKLWLGLFLDTSIKSLILVLSYFTYIIITSSISGMHLMFICLNLVKYNLPIVIICNIVYLIILYYLTIKSGLIGIILALIIQSVIVVISKYIIIKIKRLD